MAEEVLVRISVGGVKPAEKSLSALEKATKKLAYEQSEEAKELAKVNALIAANRAANNAAAFSTEEYGKAIKNAQKNTKNYRTQSGLNNAILLETGRLASDASYGFTAIANNMSQLTSLFGSFVQTTGGVVTSFKELGKSILGTGGILLALQVLIGLFQSKKFVSFLQRITGGVNLLSEAFKDAANTIKTTTGNFELYIATIKDSSKSQEEHKDAIEMLNKEFPDFIKNLNDADLSLEDIKNGTREAEDATNDYRDALLKLAMSEAARSKITDASSKKLQINIDRETKAREEGFESYAAAVEAANKTQEESTSIIAKTGTVQSTVIDTQLEKAKEIAGMRQDELDDLDKQIDLLLEFTDIQVTSNKKTKKSSEDKSKYNQLEIDDLSALIRELKDLGRVRASYNKATEQAVIRNMANEAEAMELERKNALLRLEMNREQLESYTAYMQAREAINAYYAEVNKQRREKELEREFKMRVQLFEYMSDSLGHISNLFEENSAASKAAALLEITANTAIGYIQGLRLAQKQSLESGPGASLAFPVFYASQIAAVLGAAAKAKNILTTGNAGSGDESTVSSQVEAPDFNVVGASPINQLAGVASRSLGGDNAPVAVVSLNSLNVKQGQLNRIKETAGT